MEAFEAGLRKWDEEGRLRRLYEGTHEGRWIEVSGRRMLNLSSNDYLGLAGDAELRRAFLRGVAGEEALLSSSSSRLLTGNYAVNTRLESLLAALYGTEAALTFNSGYHMNTGILPAITDSRTLVLADKLVHASLIDGIRLSPAKCIRYPHQDYRRLESLLQRHHASFARTVIVTESLFSMDGDVAPLPLLADLKRRYPGTMLYVDEAHAVGVRGRAGLGVAEEQGCTAAIDFLCGTFGKALASVGAYVVCNRTLRDYLINRMRTFIFTTALPPLNVAWTRFLLERLSDMEDRRRRLQKLSACLRNALSAGGDTDVPGSHIVPLRIGPSADTVRAAEEMQRKGFYVLPIRPPTVPEGTSRLRFSLTADMEREEIEAVAQACLSYVRLSPP